jgi:ubiquinone biosynthesis protein COQ9
MDNRSLILEHVLPLVPFDGWSEHTLALAENRAGLARGEWKRAFAGGINDCIDYYFLGIDEAVAREFPEAVLTEMRVPQRIEALLMARFAHLALHREAVRRVVAYRALPWNAAHACRSLFRTVDMIWRLAGDKSVDFSYYTRRATLAGVYGSTLLAWLDDDCGDMEKTREFLKRRLADVAAFGKSKKAFKDKFKTRTAA